MAPTDGAQDPALWPAARQAAAIRARTLSSRELLELYLARIDRFNPALNAVVTLDVDGARASAQQADDRLARGEEVGPLHGLPITVKDALATAGMRSTGGATELSGHVPQEDAPAVAALRRAGAIVMGKTNLPRWSADVQTSNDLFGLTVNPWDAERGPGGSSGGAAAAVAAGLASFDIGTDIAGSIRLPSAFCGVFGHKPTFGLVPGEGYLDHPEGGTVEADMNVIGPIARSADDLAMVLAVLGRQGPPLAAQLAPPPEDLRSLRIALWADDPFCPVDAELVARFQAVGDALQAEGYQVDREARPPLDPARAADLGQVLLRAAMVRASRSEGESHRSWLEAQAERAAMRASWAEFFRRYDIVLMPATFVPPFPHLLEGRFASRTLACNGAERPYGDAIRWTVLASAAYLPGTAVPVGLTAGDLPIGLQVVGAPGMDLVTIRLGGAIGDLCGGYRPPPTFGAGPSSVGR